MWRIARWGPLSLLLFWYAGLGGLLAVGGSAGIVGWYFLQGLAPLLSAATIFAVFMYAILKRRRSAPILVTVGVALPGLLPGLWLLGIAQIAYPASIEASRPHLTTRLPSNEPLVTFWGGDSVDRNYHAAYPDQRWAYDFGVAPLANGSEDPADYGCWETPVVAPISGEVVVAIDGLPDATPPRISNELQNPAGNHVALRTPHDTFVLIAHLREGSVRVQPGDIVEEGQELGLCGNSGNTSEPHIHIHHQRDDPRDNPIGFAVGLPLFFRDHDGPAMPRGGVEIDGDTITPLGDHVHHRGGG